MQTNTRATDTELRLSNDRKVAQHPKVPNSIGLPAGDSCPGMTEACDGCYAAALEKFRPAIRGVTERNLRVLQDAERAGGVEGILRVLRPMMDRFVASCRKHGVAAPYLFRWQWDGDVYSLAYAEAIATVMGEYAEAGVVGWIYTRSTFAVETLLGADNLAVYYSTDVWNMGEARMLVARAKAEPDSRFGRLRFAFTAADWASGKLIADFVGARSGPKCPELTGAIGLEGACAACGLCPEGRANVRFAMNKKARKDKAG